MKHIKSYMLFESILFYDEISDIVSDVKDDGISVTYTTVPHEIGYNANGDMEFEDVISLSFYIQHGLFYKSFRWDIVNNCINHLVGFMGEMGYKYHMSVDYEPINYEIRKEFKRIEQMNIGDSITILRIEFNKNNLKLKAI